MSRGGLLEGPIGPGPPHKLSGKVPERDPHEYHGVVNSATQRPFSAEEEEDSLA